MSATRVPIAFLFDVDNTLLDNDRVRRDLVEAIDHTVGAERGTWFWELYQYEFDLADVAEVWRRGSVVASWLLDLTASALVKSPDLEGFSGRVSDSGEGRWTIAAAVDEGVPAPVLTSALYARFSSRGEADFADRMLSAMRLAFGGHLEEPGERAS
ncbi:MAG: hypothetical protein WKF78_11355 [Candidatus Limnocylindrales bacterium]